MADSYGGVTIKVLTQSPVRDAGSSIHVWKIPGGGTAYIDLGGAAPETAELALLLTSDADYTALRALRGAQASLVYAEGTFSAILEDVKRDRWLPGPKHYVTARFTFP